MNTLRKYVIAGILTFASSPFSQAAIVDGYFSDWYYQGPGNRLAMDYHFNTVTIVASDSIVNPSGNVFCHSYYKCTLIVTKETNIGHAYVEQRIFSDGGTIPLELFNKRLAAILPMSGKGKITTSPGKDICVGLRITTGTKTLELTDSCTGLGPPLPPTPSVPVTCEIEGLNNSTVDFGSLNANEDARKTITATLRCTGEEGAKGSAELKLEGMDPAQKDYAVLNSISGTEKIKVRMTVGNTNSNTETVTVKAGWAEPRDLHFDINSSELAGKTGGFSGNAILSFTVL